MNIYNVGPNQLNDDDLKELDKYNYEWFIYWYKFDVYNGEGCAVALRKDGYIVIKDLCHCSCFEPLDSWEKNILVVDIAEFLRDKDDIHDIEVNEEIVLQVKKLLNL